MSKLSLAYHATVAAIVAALWMTVALLLCGCVAVEVEDYGYEVVKDKDGVPLRDASGAVQTVHKGQRWHMNKNMVEQQYDDVVFERQVDNVVKFRISNYKDVVSPELNKIVETSFKGAAELAAKIGAAIATSGGSVAGEAAYSALSKTIKNYLSKGGSAEKATVECKDGSCTITDGTITETCTDCLKQ